MLIHSASTIRRSRPVPGGSVSDPSPNVPSVYLPTQPSWAQSQLTWIHWSVPVRAYPGIDLDFKLTGYDWHNRTLTWSLDTAPSGMTINSTTGVISWTPSSPSQDGDHSVTARMTPSGGTPITKSWTINVNTTQFLFIATTGTDSPSNGAIGSPLATLDYACDLLTVSTPKTIYMRGGTYSEWFDWGAGAGPLAGIAFTATTPVVIASYPTETAVIDCGLSGSGPLAQGAYYIIFDKITVINAAKTTGQESCGLGLHSTNVAKRCIATDADWDYTDNCTGFRTMSDTVLDSCTARDNYNTGSGTAFNNHNFLHYNDKGDGGDAFIIDCLSDGGSVSGFKIKHAGSLGQAHFHRCVDTGDKYPFIGGSNYSSFRYCIGISTTGGSGVRSGIYASDTDADLGYLYQHNLFTIDTQIDESGVIQHSGDSHFSTTTADTGIYVKENILISKQGGTSAGRGSPLYIGFYKTTAAVENINFPIIDNEIYAPADQYLMKVGTSTIHNLSGINGISTNSGNTYDTVPTTVDQVAGNGANVQPYTTWRWTSSTNTVAVV